MAEKENKDVKKEETAQPQQKEHKDKKTDNKTEEGGPKKTTQQKREERASSIIRLAGKDVNGTLNLERALAQVKGIGASLSHSLVFAIETKLNIPKSTNLGSLSEEQIESIENLMKNPAQFGIPKYLLNRQKDMETGKDLHLVSNELIFATRQDVSRDLALRTWRGHRHQYGQKVRGQRTRSTGRTGTTVGVIKKAELAKSAPAAAGKPAEAKKEEKKPAA
ncbi:MAG: 30S ribosomal protein S13 [Candidatus Micrarchaeales archaeon]